MAFLQEVPDDALIADWVDDGFVAAPHHGPRFNTRSMLLWRDAVAELVDDWTLPTGDYHGSYVSSALLRLPGTRGPVACVSFHASPTPVAAVYEEAWLRRRPELPSPRHGGGATSGELYDADFVVSTLKQVARDHPVLAAGDLNECLLWDQCYDETWGRLIHEEVTSSPGQLEFSLHRIWGREIRTLFKAGARGYQLDHVLATPEIGGLVGDDAHVDPSWTVARAEAGELSGHAPIYFRVDTET